MSLEARRLAGLRPLQGILLTVVIPALKSRAASLSPFGARFWLNVSLAFQRYPPLITVLGINSISP